MRDLNLIEEIIMLESENRGGNEQRVLKRVVQEFGKIPAVRMALEKFQRTKFKAGSDRQKFEELCRFLVKMLLELVDRAKNASRSFIEKIKNREFMRVFKDKLTEGVRSVIKGMKGLKTSFEEIIASMGSVLSQAWTFACNLMKNYGKSEEFTTSYKDEVTNPMHPNAAPAQPDEQGILALANEQAMVHSKSTRSDVQGILALAEQHGVTLDTKAASAVRRLSMAYRNAVLGTDSTKEKQLQVIGQLQELLKDLPAGTTLGEIKQISKVSDQAALLAIEDAERPNAPGPEINRVRIAVDPNEAATKIQGFARMVAAKSAVGERRKEAKKRKEKQSRAATELQAGVKEKLLVEATKPEGSFVSSEVSRLDAKLKKQRAREPNSGRTTKTTRRGKSSTSLTTKEANRALKASQQGAVDDMEAFLNEGQEKKQRKPNGPSTPRGM